MVRTVGGLGIVPDTDYHIVSGFSANIYNERTLVRFDDIWVRCN